MPVPVGAAVLAAIEILGAIREAHAAGKTEITDAQWDGMWARIEASDSALSDAIARARAREAGGG